MKHLVRSGNQKKKTRFAGLFFLTGFRPVLPLGQCPPSKSAALHPISLHKSLASPSPKLVLNTQQHTCTTIVQQPSCINESRFLTVCRDFALRDLGMDLSTVNLQPEFRKFLLDFENRNCCMEIWEWTSHYSTCKLNFENRNCSMEIWEWTSQQLTCKLNFKNSFLDIWKWPAN